MSRNDVFEVIASFIGSGINGNLRGATREKPIVSIASFIGSGINGNVPSGNVKGVLT